MTASRSKFTNVLVIALALTCTACGEQVEQAKAEAQKRIDSVSAMGDKVNEAIDQKVNQAIDEARQKLRTENLALGGGEHLPKAEVTPQGELLINGVAVPMTEAQRTAMLAYREQLLVIAESGMNMGADGAKLAGDAVTQVTGLLDGKVADATAKLEAEADRMAAAGLALCEQVKGLEATQAQLSALIPEFAAYAGAIKVDADCATAADSMGQTAASDQPKEAPAAPAAGN